MLQCDLFPNNPQALPPVTPHLATRKVRWSTKYFILSDDDFGNEVEILQFPVIVSSCHISYLGFSGWFMILWYYDTRAMFYFICFQQSTVVITYRTFISLVLSSKPRAEIWKYLFVKSWLKAVSCTDLIDIT